MAWRWHVEVPATGAATYLGREVGGFGNVEAMVKPGVVSLGEGDHELAGHMQSRIVLNTELPAKDKGRSSMSKLKRRGGEREGEEKSELKSRHERT